MDKTALYCSRKKNMIADEKFPKSVLDSYDASINVNSRNSTVLLMFYCNDGHVISPQFICNGRKGCPDKSDELYCSCVTNNLEILSSTYCVLKCKLPTCKCMEPLLQKHQGGCVPYISEIQQNENNMSVSCSNKTIYCLYEIVSRENRQQRYCKTGHHLQSCEKVHCSKTYKCLGYYCLPCLYVCDGH